MLTRTKKKPRIEIISLIDVIFFILIFFMLFTNFDTNIMGMNVDLPKAVTATTQQPSNLTITISKSGAFQVDGQTVNSNQLQSQVKAAIGNNPDTFIIIKADKATQYEHVIKAMDAVRAVGSNRLGLAVERIE